MARASITSPSRLRRRNPRKFIFDCQTHGGSHGPPSFLRADARHDKEAAFLAGADVRTQSIGNFICRWPACARSAAFQAGADVRHKLNGCGISRWSACIRGAAFRTGADVSSQNLMATLLADGRRAPAVPLSEPARTLGTQFNGCVINRPAHTRTPFRSSADASRKTQWLRY